MPASLRVLPIAVHFEHQTLPECTQKPKYYPTNTVALQLH